MIKKKNSIKLVTCSERNMFYNTSPYSLEQFHIPEVAGHCKDNWPKIKLCILFFIPAESNVFQLYLDRKKPMIFPQWQQYSSLLWYDDSHILCFIYMEMLLQSKYVMNLKTQDKYVQNQRPVYIWWKQLFKSQGRFEIKIPESILLKCCTGNLQSEIIHYLWRM